MTLHLFAGSGNPPLAEGIAQQLGCPLGRRELHRFPDGELQVALEESVRGGDVYLLQPTSPLADAHLLELLFLADACRRAGAARVTAVIPYFGYARQDRRARGREPVGIRVVADVLHAGGVQHVVAVDLHSPTLEGVFAFPLEHVSAVPLLAEAVRPHVRDGGIIVAPDLGAVKLAERYARLLHLPVAIVHKMRLTGESVTALRIIGDVAGRAPVLVDDMISTGATIEAAARLALESGCQRELIVVATHALLVDSAVERLRELSVRRVVVTDSVAPPSDRSLPLDVVSLGPLLAEVIRRLHADQSLTDLLFHG